MVEFFGVNDEFVTDLTRVYNEVERRFSLPKHAKVNLNFVSNEEIRELNKTTRNIDKVTDVLSYPYTNLKVGEKLKLSQYKYDIDPIDKTLTIGDIYICLDKARSQAEEYGHSITREVCFLFCHGLLHILGYDHIEVIDASIMEKEQAHIMNAVGIRREPFKCGFVTILGDTNVGKSTLINALVGEHVAIVSPKTQTTRENIQGIYNDDNSQIVFVDTPGYHKRSNKVDDEMDKHIENAQADTEIVLMMIPANRPLVDAYEKLDKRVSASAKRILIINKIDEVKYETLYPQLVELSSRAKVDEILPISAKTGRNIDVLLEMVKKYLPSFDHEFRYYPIDEYTDKNLRHMVAEIVREKILLCLDDEIPHGVQVMVTEYHEDTDPVEVSADIYCEKENHKAIILGKNGDMIKKIGTMARKSIEYITNAHINLNLFVRTRKDWRNNPKDIIEFGLNASE